MAALLPKSRGSNAPADAMQQHRVALWVKSGGINFLPIKCQQFLLNKSATTWVAKLAAREV